MESWVMTERILDQEQAADTGFFEEFTAWCFGTKWPVVKFVKLWMSIYFSA